MKTRLWLRRRVRTSAAGCGCFLLLATAPLLAQTLLPTVTKLHGRSPDGVQAFHSFGRAVAMSGRFLLVGEPWHGNAAGSSDGAAYLFDARTGRYLREFKPSTAMSNAQFGHRVALWGNRALTGALGENAANGAAYLHDPAGGRLVSKLLPPDGAANFVFGHSVALGGGLALVGAYENAYGNGAVYVFDARSGAFLRKLVSSDNQVEDHFGSSLAVSGDLALIGAYGDDGNKGSAYLFELSSGTEVRKLTASDGAANHFFGFSVALSGGLALVGAQGDTASAGSAYVFDARAGGAHLHKLTAGPDANPNDEFGYSVALDGGLALVGAWRDDFSKGAAYLFDVRSGARLARLQAQDGESDGNGDRFGASVALCNGQTLIGASQDDDPIMGTDAGSAYFIRPLAAPLPLRRVAARGSSAAGVVDAVFRDFPRVFNDNGDSPVVHGKLSDRGASGGRNQGVWKEVGLPPKLAVRVKDTDLGGGVRASKILDAWCNSTPHALMNLALTGPGINGANNQGLFVSEWSGTPSLLVNKGGSLPGVFGGAVFGQFHQVLQGVDFMGRVAVNLRLRAGSGFPAVTAANDSALLFVDYDGVALPFPRREGDGIAGGLFTLGQLQPRVGLGMIFSSNRCVFAGAVIPASGGAARQAMFQSDYTVANLEPFAVSGEDAPGTGVPAAQYRTFLAECLADISSARRATLSGPGVTSANNEALWKEGWFDDLLIARKGDEVDPEWRPGVKFARFHQLWPMNFDTALLVLAKLSGPGINSANDMALLLWDRDAVPPHAPWQVLLQEGDTVEGTDGAAVKTILRVDANVAHGGYAALCSLTGAADRNLALFSGEAHIGNAGGQRAARRAVLKLRKGALYAAPLAGATRLRSMLFSPSTDATGVGGKGLGIVIGPSGGLAFVADFDNKAREVLAGKP